MNKNILLRIKEFNNTEILKFFFGELKHLIDELGLKNDSENLALNVRNDDRKRFSVNINNRLVFGISLKNASYWICYMVYEKDLLKIKNFDKLGNPEVFAKMKNEEQAVLIWIKYEDVLTQIDLLKELWIDCCKDFLPKHAKSNLRVYHVPELFDMATNEEVLESYLNNIQKDKIYDQDFFTDQDFSNLKKYAGVKKNDSEEHNNAYNELKKTYDKIAYWANAIAEKNFSHVNGYVDVLRKPTNQANTFEFYQWAKIYPSSKCSEQLAFTVSIEKEEQFTVKIDTVGLKENNEIRKAYLKYKADKNNSEIVLNIPKAEIISKGWENLITVSSDFITGKINEYFELEELLGLLNTNDKNDTESLIKYQKMSLNTILYGPPGTGKTYNTINKALEILGEQVQDKPRQELKEIFGKRVEDGRIVFTTFHQGMSYEDFIEGIKPLKPEPGESLKYDLEKGIFKRICEKAQSNYDNSKNENQGRLPFEEAFEKLQDEWEANPSIKFPLKTAGYEFTILGFTNTSIQFRKASGGTGHTLSINTLKEQYYGKDFNFKQGVGIYYPGILHKLFSYKKDVTEKVKLLNYVLIIDEINRGNVSQIFGELITLLEEDKRQGEPEALTLILPYSKESFSVPPNLYILGTMNTADRSVEALDTALRRRFVFEEMKPDESLLSSQELIVRLYAKYPDTDWNDKGYRKEATQLYSLIGIDESFEKMIRQNDKPDYADDDKIRNLKKENFSGVNLHTLLSAINKRLEALLSKDHTIGHAWLMNVFSLEDLQSAFKNKILPLLQEFFYNDYAKIGLVLGNEFVETEDVKADLFAKFKGSDELAGDYTEKVIYKLKNPSDINLQGFMSIYK